MWKKYCVQQKRSFHAIWFYEAKSEMKGLSDTPLWILETHLMPIQ